MGPPQTFFQLKYIADKDCIDKPLVHLKRCVLKSFSKVCDKGGVTTRLIVYYLSNDFLRINTRPNIGRC